MTRWFASRIRRIIGRLDKVKIIRDLLLIIFVVVFSYFSPAFSNLIQNINSPELNKIILENPIFYIAIFLVIAIVILPLIFINKIDKWEDKKADKQHQELLDAINNLTDEIRNDRNERNKPKP